MSSQKPALGKLGKDDGSLGHTVPKHVNMFGEVEDRAPTTEPSKGSCVASEQFLGNISSGGTDKVEETDPAVMWPVRGKVSNKCLADHYSISNHAQKNKKHKKRANTKDTPTFTKAKSDGSASGISDLGNNKAYAHATAAPQSSLTLLGTQSGSHGNAALPTMSGASAAYAFNMQVAGSPDPNDAARATDFFTSARPPPIGTSYSPHQLEQQVADPCATSTDNLIVSPGGHVYATPATRISYFPFGNLAMANVIQQVGGQTPGVHDNSTDGVLSSAGHLPYASTAAAFVAYPPPAATTVLVEPHPAANISQQPDHLMLGWDTNGANGEPATPGKICPIDVGPNAVSPDADNPVAGGPNPGSPVAGIPNPGSPVGGSPNPGSLIAVSPEAGSPNAGSPSESYVPPPPSGAYPEITPSLQRFKDPGDYLVATAAGDQTWGFDFMPRAGYNLMGRVGQHSAYAEAFHNLPPIRLASPRTTTQAAKVGDVSLVLPAVGSPVDGGMFDLGKDDLTGYEGISSGEFEELRAFLSNDSDGNAAVS